MSAKTAYNTSCIWIDPVRIMAQHSNSFTKATEIRIRNHLEAFLANKFKSIADMSAWDLGINPFLIAVVRSQLKMDTAYDLAEWLVRQRIERGIVTGFGMTLQQIAKEFSNERPLPDLTIRVKKEDKIYNFMIKSGPNPYSMQAARNMQRILLATKKTDPGSTPIFAMCYGDEESISGVVKTHLGDVRQMIGKDFWEFVSGDPGCQRKILQIASEVGRDYKDSRGNSLNRIIEDKIKYVEGELIKLYGGKNDFWRNVMDGVH